VETMTAPSTLKSEKSVSWMSPVPGGMSTMRTSSGAAGEPQRTSLII